jgi:hypothetical protein
MKNLNPTSRSHYPPGPKGDAAWRAYCKPATAPYFLFPHQPAAWLVTSDYTLEGVIDFVLESYEHGLEDSGLDNDSALFKGETLVATFLAGKKGEPRVIRFV